MFPLFVTLKFSVSALSLFPAGMQDSNPFFEQEKWPVVTRGGEQREPHKLIATDRQRPGGPGDQPGRGLAFSGIYTTGMTCSHHGHSDARDAPHPTFRFRVSMYSPNPDHT